MVALRMRMAATIHRTRTRTTVRGWKTQKIVIGVQRQARVPDVEPRGMNITKSGGNAGKVKNKEDGYSLVGQQCIEELRPKKEGFFNEKDRTCN
jgi:hypothetical protein